MHNHTAPKNHPDESDAGVLQHLFAGPPAFPCALPANLAQFRPQFMAEPEDHSDPAHDAQ